MKPYHANLIASATLIIFGSWAYLNMDAATRSMTVLIPVFFGLALAICSPWLKQQNKVVAHIVAVLTLLIALALIMPLRSTIGRADPDGIFRVSCMMVASLFALVIYIRSFLDVRRARQSVE